MKLFATVLLLSLSISAKCQDRIETIERLMEAQGLLQTFEQQMATERQSARRQADEMMNQMLASLEVSPELTAKMQAASSAFLNAAQPPWTAEDLVDVWAKYYGSGFTDDELKQLLAFYSSPLAQREVLAGREALEKFSAHFQDLNKPIAAAAVKEYVARLQKIVQECNCRRKNGDGV